VRAEPADVMSEGRFAQFTDPAGAMFAIWQPGNTKGLGDILGQVPAAFWVMVSLSKIDDLKKPRAS
jgi:hypothetical protein